MVRNMSEALWVVFGMIEEGSPEARAIAGALNPVDWSAPRPQGHGNTHRRTE